MCIVCAYVYLEGWGEEVLIHCPSGLILAMEFRPGFSLGQSCLSLRVLGITGTSCHCWLQLRIIPLLKKTDKSLKAPDDFSKFYLTVLQENRENLRTNQPNKQIKVLWKSIIVLKFIRHGTWLGARQMTYLINITELALPELNNHLYLLKSSLR